MNKHIENTLSFILEVDKLKSVYRKTRPTGLERYENSAEHSWQVSLLAMMMADFASEKVDINRVIRMLLIHDLGEIDAGDTIIYASDNQEYKQAEENGIRRILNMLPEGKGDLYFELWKEFEAGDTPDAKFARSMDRVMPLLHNIHGEGRGWKENGIRKEQVIEVNSKIAEGCSELWDVVRARLEGVIEKGILN